MRTHLLISLTMTAILRPWSGDLRMCSSSVVLPLPYITVVRPHSQTSYAGSILTKNPESSVTGRRRVSCFPLDAGRLQERPFASELMPIFNL